MLLVDQAILALQGLIFCFSAIALGLMAYLVHLLRHPVPLYEFNGDGTVYTGRDVVVSLANSYVFALFSSSWSILVVVFLLATTFTKRSQQSGFLVGAVKFGLSFLSFVFALSAFAAYAAQYGGYLITSDPYFGALSAFIILSWIAWLGLCVINLLTAVGHVQSEHYGYHALTAHISKTLPSDQAESNVPEA